MARWLIPPTEFALEAGEAHIWKLSLERLATSSRECLSGAEADRARRFRFPRDRDRFVGTRSVLRQLLAGYLGCAPRQVAFRYGAKGKPELAGDATDVRFNLAHSHDLALFAFSRDVELGVDVEQVRTGPAEERIPERFFSPAETQALRSLPVPDQRDAFFRCWTRKEAFLKAYGEGITFGLNQFSVSIPPDEPPRILETPYAPEEAARCELYDLEPGLPYVGALAARGSLNRLRYWLAGETSG